MAVSIQHAKWITNKKKKVTWNETFFNDVVIEEVEKVVICQVKYQKQKGEKKLGLLWLKKKGGETFSITALDLRSFMDHEIDGHFA